jgi:hypothetical protein
MALGSTTTASASRRVGLKANTIAAAPARTTMLCPTCINRLMIWLGR